jgi:glyoxylase-like metal-dependent hydrolase (beta-lactamase superfamily II)
VQELHDLREALTAELERLDIIARPIVIPTPWDVGPVTAYLFPTDPVTLIDAGINTPDARSAITDALGAEALAPNDVRRIIVTHAHLDHFGGALWLQGESSCVVHLHPDDIAIADPSSWRHTNEVLFPPLGFTDKEIASFWSDEGPYDMRAPVFSEMTDGTVFETGDTRLRIEHHAGHSPGHVWVVEEASGAIFVGDYIIGDHPTNAGMEIDSSEPMGRARLLEQYNAGLRELRDRPAPVLFPAHGPPIVDHAALIDRRLTKSARRTRHVLEGVVKHPNSTAIEIGRALYGGRPDRSWEVVADLVGRLDLLVAEGRVSARMEEDGAWHFTATEQHGEN